MFTTASSLSNLNVPQFETRKALIIINLQNDSFYHEGDIFICKNRDFAENIRNLVSIFRNVGDIVWVRTEIAPSTSSTPAYLDTRRDLPEKDSVAPKPEGTSRQRLKDGGDDMESEEYYSPSWPATTMQPKDVQDNSPLSLVESMEMHASAQAMAEKRSTNTSILVDNTNLMEDKPAKIPPGLLPKVYIAGTPGAETLDELKPLVDEERDMTVVKKYYSAFDQTSLLMSLRMRLVTELYICGCLTNIAVYATAADAVQHGFEVNLVEDCLGYRTAAKHEEAIRQMADVFGVNGVDSEEIIAESGGQAPPDTEEPMFVGPGSAGITLGESHPTDDHSSANVPKPPRNKTIEGPSSQPEVKPKVSRRSLELELPTDRGSKGRRARPGESPPTAKIGGLGSGDSRILHDVLISPLKTDAFQLLRGEVKWQVMHHRGGEVPRLVAVQGQIGEEGSIPIYRHPADESPPLLPFSSTVEQIRKEIERAIKQPLNHVLIQLYRDGVDNISEHSDKVGFPHFIRFVRAKLMFADAGHCSWIQYYQPKSWRTANHDPPYEETETSH